MFTKNNNTTLKHKTDGKVNFCSRCIGSSFKKFANNDEEEISDLSKKV